MCERGERFNCFQVKLHTITGHYLCDGTSYLSGPSLFPPVCFFECLLHYIGLASQFVDSSQLQGWKRESTVTYKYTFTLSLNPFASRFCFSPSRVCIRSFTSYYLHSRWISLLFANVPIGLFLLHTATKKKIFQVRLSVQRHSQGPSFSLEKVFPSVHLHFLL